MACAPSSGFDLDDSSIVQEPWAPGKNRLPSIPSGLELDEKELNEKLQEGLGSRQSTTDRQSSDSRSTATSSLISEASSSCEYANSEQTLIFLDWDDTLFPTTFLSELYPTELVDGKKPLPLSDVLEAAMESWRQALTQYMCAIRQSCMRCAIITNSKRPWVHSCIERFHPDLSRMIKEDLQHSICIMYADEELKKERTAGNCFGGCLQWMHKFCESEKSPEDQRQELTLQKHAAMFQEASNFYSRYQNQTWKNILCIGDGKPEHDAVKTLTTVHTNTAPFRERLRTKRFRVPTTPSMKQLTFNLKLAAVLHPVYVAFDGDLDLDFTKSLQLAEAASIFGIPQLEAWSMASDSEEENLPGESEFLELECAVRDWQENADLALDV